MNIVWLYSGHRERNLWPRGGTMIYPVNHAMTALAAFRKRLDVTANNVANVNTDEFKKSRVNLEEGSHGGVQARVQQINTPGIPKESIRNDEITEVESSNVDLAEELTDLISTRASYGANIRTLRTGDEMLGSLLDIIG